ncbi:MAG: hypothetical protein J5855_05850 [Mailhella sp.]|nr:hypothetical protein [Mailhella sp.]
MKGFYRYLAPFAPDYSGAVSVLFDMGGLIVLCDPGGCSGNVCGYDEPRFYGSHGRIFSAALRDMDTIFGRDDKLLSKIVSAMRGRHYPFAALIGTPVTGVIGTDLKAVARMASKELGMPVLAIDTNGSDTYETGQKKAWRALLAAFGPGTDTAVSKSIEAKEKKTVLVLGATPLDCTADCGLEALKRTMRESAPDKEFIFAGDPGTYRIGELAVLANEAVVCSPAALESARFLEKHGIPFTSRCVFPEEFARIAEAVRAFPGSSPKILAVHQQIAANSLREKLSEVRPDASVHAASFFGLDAKLANDGDLALKEEDDFMAAAGGADIIIGDPLFKRALAGSKALFLDLPHFAVSGDLFARSVP